MSRRDARRLRQKLLGAIILGIAGVVLGGMATYYGYRVMTATKYDEQLCPSGRVPGVVVVVIDTSDPMSERQTLSIKNFMAELKRTTPKEHRLDVFNLAADQTSVGLPIFSVCNPGDGSDVSRVSGNPERVRATWEQRFSEKVDGAMQRALSAGSSTHSPIMETIQSVALTSFAKVDASTQKKLVIISDMIHFTPEYSQYLPVAGFDAFKRESAAYLSKVRTSLKGVEVTIAYVRRPTQRNIQGKAHVDFWDAYFREMGGSVGLIRSVEG
jgi:hypothetical protein